MIRTPAVLSSSVIMTAMFLFHPSLASAQGAPPRVTSQPTADEYYQPITDEDIQMMRKDIRSQRKQIIAANMKLSDAESEKFWPVYEQYISELVKINGVKYDLIKRYVQTGGALTDPEAESAAKQWVEIDQSVAELRMKYIPNFRKVLSPKSTALFYQLDRRVQLMIDLQLASSLPLIEP